MDKTTTHPDPVLRHRRALGAAMLVLGVASGWAVGWASLRTLAVGDSALSVLPGATVSVLGGWSFAAAALLLPEDAVAPRIRVLLLSVSAGWLAPAGIYLDVTWLRVISVVLSGVWLSFLAHLLLVYPDGDAPGPARRAVIAAAYLSSGPATALSLVSTGFWVAAVTAAVRLGFAVLLLVALVHRWRAMPGPRRRAIMPVLIGGGVVVSTLATVQALTVQAPLADIWHTAPPPNAVDTLTGAALFALPAGFAVAVGRMRLDQGAVGELAAELGHAVTPDRLQAALATALHDPTVRVAYWADEAGWVDGGGAAVTVPDDPDRVVPVSDDAGAPVAAIVHAGGGPERHRLVEAVAATARLALENTRLRAEVSAQLTEISASRARIVAAAGAERRRLERDLHDGAQQRLVNATMALALARGPLARAGDEHAMAAVDEAAAELRAALTELREIARGLHPAILTGAGLGPAVQALVERSRLAATMRVDVPRRLAEPVEITAYYTIAEALANVTKHAAATSVQVEAVVTAGVLLVRVTDDGTGGADPGAGSGLRGLMDRVAAVGGRLRIGTPASGGTELEATIPCGS